MIEQYAANIRRALLKQNVLFILIFNILIKQPRRKNITVSKSDT